MRAGERGRGARGGGGGGRGGAAAGVAYVPGEAAPPVNDGVRALDERVRAAFDPEGILAS